MVAVQTNPYSTAPAIATSDPTAVMGRRIGAYLIDAALGFAVMVVAFITILDKVTMPSSQSASDLCDLVNNSPGSNICIAAGSTVYGGTGSDITEISLVMLAFFAIFHVVLPTLTGYSPGKGMLGLRVVKQDTFQHAGIGANAVRGLLWVIDALPFMVPLVGFITGLASKGHRRVGDMAASTFVVMKESVGSPTQVAGLTAPVGAGVSAPPPSNWAPPSPTAPPASAPATPPAPASPPVVSPPVVSPPVASPPVASPPVASPPVSTPPDTPEPDPTPPPAAAESRPGVDAPQWDEARNTYIQWDPELEQWMEWGESQGKWIPISQ